MRDAGRDADVLKRKLSDAASTRNGLDGASRAAGLLASGAQSAFGALGAFASVDAIIGGLSRLESKFRDVDRAAGSVAMTAELRDPKTRKAIIDSNRVVILGTSLIQHNTRVSGASIGHWSRGFLTWAQVLEPRIRFDVWLDPADANGRGFTGANHGVSGQTCDQILARLAAVIAMRPALVVLDMGTNDMGALAKEVIQGKRELACAILTAAGIPVAILPILARGTETYAVASGVTRVAWAAGTAERAKANWINHQTRYFAPRSPMVVSTDWNDGYVNPSSLNGEPYPGFSNDGTHQAALGGYAIGKKIAAFFASIFPPGNPSAVSLDDRFDAVNNPPGNLFSNALMVNGQQAAGSAGTGVTGTLADLMRVERNTGGSSGTASVVQRSEKRRGFWQRLAITLAGSGVDVFYIRPALTELVLPSTAAWYQAGIDVAVSAYGGWRGINLRCDLRSASSSFGMANGMDPADADLGAAARAVMPDEAWSGTIVTPPFQVPAGADRVRYRLEAGVDAATAGAPVIDAGALWLRQVPDPRPVWGIAA